MSPITPGQRVFFAVICAAALLVAILGLFNPVYLASIFTWLELPPLHARFVGAIYAFGAVFMAGCLAARYQAEVRWAVQLIGIWTGMLFIISLLNLDAFDFSQPPRPAVLLGTERHPAAVKRPKVGAVYASYAVSAMFVAGLVVAATLLSRRRRGRVPASATEGGGGP